MVPDGNKLWKGLAGPSAEACTGLHPKNDGRPQVRRFRPGLDYTVAARGAQDTDEARKKLELKRIGVFENDGKTWKSYKRAIPTTELLVYLGNL